MRCCANRGVKRKLSRGTGAWQSGVTAGHGTGPRDGWNWQCPGQGSLSQGRERTSLSFQTPVERLQLWPWLLQDFSSSRGGVVEERMPVCPACGCWCLPSVIWSLWLSLFLHASAQAFSSSTYAIITVLMVVEHTLCSGFRRFSNTVWIGITL